MAKIAKKVVENNTQEKLEQFIKDNGLTFKKGNRNADSVVLSGYALHLGVSDVSEVKKAIDIALAGKDPDYSEELSRVFDYAVNNNYGKWWETSSAKSSYKF